MSLVCSTYIINAFNIDLSKDNNRDDLPFSVEFLRREQEIRTTSTGIDKRYDKTERIPERDTAIIHTDPLDYKPLYVWSDVTEEIDHIRRKHGENWVVLGRIFHSLFEALSRSLIGIDEIDEKIDTLIRLETTSTEAVDLFRDIIRKDVKKMKDSGLLDEIVLPKDNSFTELPFILQRGNKIYKGRIDRIIIEKGIARIYDYKTYPVTEKEIPELKEKYSFQLQLYREAIERIFSVRTESYLFFTHELRLERI